MALNKSFILRIFHFVAKLRCLGLRCFAVSVRCVIGVGKEQRGPMGLLDPWDIF